jgi:hypothetical protein
MRKSALSRRGFSPGIGCGAIIRSARKKLGVKMISASRNQRTLRLTSLETRAPIRPA